MSRLFTSILVALLLLEMGVSDTHSAALRPSYLSLSEGNYARNPLRFPEIQGGFESPKLSNNYNKFNAIAPQYPQFPIKKFVVGLRTGLNVFHGDIDSKNRLHIGLDLIKPVGMSAGVRATFAIGYFAGLKKNPITVLPGSIDDKMGYKSITYSNFETLYLNMGLQLKLDFNSIGFVEEQFFKIYGFFGPALFFYIVNSDLLDADGRIYDYSNGLEGVEFDGEYETLMEVDSAVQTFIPIAPILTLGMGVTFNLTPVIAVGFDYTYHAEMLYKTDLWDGRRYQENGQTLSPDYDGLSSFDAYVNYKIGPTIRMVTLDIPEDMDVGDIIEIKKKLKDMSIDSDEDGVADYTDKELNSPPGAIVSVNGVTLDSDKDGIPDYLDKEPYSPFPELVDSTGKTPRNSDGVPLYLIEFMEKKSGK